MKIRMMMVALAVAALAVPAMAIPTLEITEAAEGQSSALPAVSPLPLPPQLEKDLAARAANVTEVTLGKNMLDFATKFMDNKDKDQAAARQLIQGLDGIYVRDYEFDKDGQYSMDQIDQLRRAFETPEWSPIVRTHESKSNETTDVMVKLVNGQPQGMFILSAEPRELSIVLILGPIRMDQLGMLKGLGGLDALGNIDTGKPPKDKTKDKPNKGGGE